MSQLFLPGLGLHIIGITLIAGGSNDGMIPEHNVWQQIHSGQQAEARTLSGTLSPFPKIIQAGTLLMLFSGLLMLGIIGWQVAEQYLFIIKMALVAVLVLNGMLAARPIEKKPSVLIRNFKGTDGSETPLELKRLHKKMRLFHFSELSMLLLVYVLAVFKF